MHVECKDIQIAADTVKAHRDLYQDGTKGLRDGFLTSKQRQLTFVVNTG
jgi:hypothetical protein